jgi:hypothetical protein
MLLVFKYKHIHDADNGVLVQVEWPDVFVSSGFKDANFICVSAYELGGLVLFVHSVCTLLLLFAHNLSSSTSSHEREHAVKLTGPLQMYANLQCGIYLYISTKLIPS